MGGGAMGGDSGAGGAVLPVDRFGQCVQCGIGSLAGDIRLHDYGEVAVGCTSTSARLSVFDPACCRKGSLDQEIARAQPSAVLATPARGARRGIRPRRHGDDLGMQPPQRVLRAGPGPGRPALASMQPAQAAK